MKPAAMRKVRLVHQYVALFFAPTILLFAISGALQTFGLHETHDPMAPAPPRWIVWLASIHKDQSFPRAERRHQPPAMMAPARLARLPRESDAAHHKNDRSPLPLKIFVAALAAGLSLSTLLGITIALTNRVMRATALIMLAAGTMVPLVLLFL